jgi:NAD(P)-dependent dehydrogenase (short-subunit alcohol dehydrogenase family)
MQLTKKVAIVTGGNSGIGKAIVLELAREGANVVVDYISHPDATDELEKQVAALGDRAIGVDEDVSKVADLEKLVATAVILLYAAQSQAQRIRRISVTESFKTSDGKFFAFGASVVYHLAT